MLTGLNLQADPAVTTCIHRLRALGLTPRTKVEADGRKFPFVAFAAPPSGSEDYAAEVCANYVHVFPRHLVCGQPVFSSRV